MAWINLKVTSDPETYAMFNTDRIFAIYSWWGTNNKGGYEEKGSLIYMGPADEDHFRVLVNMADVREAIIAAERRGP